MRFLLPLALLVALVPNAAAEPIATVAVGPEGLADEGEPYYLAVTVEAPAPATPAPPCEGDADAHALALVTDAAAPVAFAEGFHSTEPYVPTCVEAGPASLDLDDGTYSVAPPVRSPIPTSGGMGIRVNADCVGCPPP